MSTSSIFKFSKKLKNLKPLIREMGREKLENLTKRTKDAFGILCESRVLLFSIRMQLLYKRKLIVWEME